MNGQQIVREIESRRRDSDQFIRWWRKENDFVDYELIDHFLDTVNEDEEYEDYELLDAEAMWANLKSRLADRVSREKRKTGEMIFWKRPGKQDQSCLFSPKSIMTIFDVETRGNVIEP